MSLLSKGVICFGSVWNPLLFLSEVIFKHRRGYKIPVFCCPDRRELVVYFNWIYSTITYSLLSDTYLLFHVKKIPLCLFLSYTGQSETKKIISHSVSSGGKVEIEFGVLIMFDFLGEDYNELMRK